MTSARQYAANRRNALRSTGPTSTEGKAVSRLNALRHGLLARDVVLPDEDVDAFEELHRAMLADLAPVGPVETLLAERAINAAWRLRRLERAEAALLHWRTYTAKATLLAGIVTSHEEDGLAGILDEPLVTDEAAHAAASDALGQAQAERDRDETLLGRAVDADARGADALGKLSRYEAGLERTLYRALYELRQCREARQEAHTVEQAAS